MRDSKWGTNCERNVGTKLCQTKIRLSIPKWERKKERERNWWRKRLEKWQNIMKIHAIVIFFKESRPEMGDIGAEMKFISWNTKSNHFKSRCAICFFFVILCVLNRNCPANIIGIQLFFLTRWNSLETSKPIVSLGLYQINVIYLKVENRVQILEFSQKRRNPIKAYQNCTTVDTAS